MTDACDEPITTLRQRVIHRSWVTAPGPAIGSDKAFSFAHRAHGKDLSLKDEALASGYVDD